MIESDQPVTCPPTFTLDIEDGASEAHRVPSSVLVAILENAQRAFELIGLHIERWPMMPLKICSSKIGGTWFR